MTHEEALRKAIGCLKLSKSANQDEAALAASMAQKIIDKYQLDVNNIDFDAQADARDKEEVQDYGYSDPLDDVRYFKPWMLYLASTVARANSCRIVYQKVDSIGDGKCRGAKIKVIGRPSDVAATRYLHGFLKREVDRLCEENCKGNSSTYKRQFKLGVVETIRVKLEQQRRSTFEEARAEQSNNQMALVRVNNAIAKMQKRDADVDAFVKANLKIRHGGVTGGGGTATGISARAHGRQAGQQVRLTKASGSLGSGVKTIGGGS
jgi:hypothetical protein